jgi:hypothetical protein
VVLEQKESTRLRIAAFTVLKSTQPSHTTLQLIAHSLRTERSTQVKTFIYSSLVNSASDQSHIPELLKT